MMSNRGEWMEAGAVALAALVVIACIVAGMFGRYAAETVFRFGFLLGSVVVPGWYGFRALEDARHRAELRRRELSRMDRENRRLDFVNLESAGSFFRLDVRNGNVFTDHRPAAPRRVSFHAGSGPDAVGRGADPERLPPVLPLLANPELCLLFCGGRGRGKTVMAQWALMESRPDAALVLDPKPSAPGKWPPWARVIGSGYDYPEIESGIRALNANLDKPLGRFVLLIDELNLICQNLPAFPSLWVQCLEAGREHGKAVWIVGQSKTARGLGLAGSYDLLANFDYIVTAKWNRTTGERWAEVEEGGEDTALYAPPPAFPGFPRIDGPGPAGGAYQHRQRDDGFVDVDPEDVTERANGSRNATPRRVAGLLGMFRRPDMSEARERIFDVLYRSGRPLRPKEIESETGLQGGFIRKTLREMEGAGIVKRPGRGRYSL